MHKLVHYENTDEFLSALCLIWKSSCVIRTVMNFFIWEIDLFNFLYTLFFFEKEKVVDQVVTLVEK